MKYLFIILFFACYCARIDAQGEPSTVLSRAWETQSVALLDSFFREWEASTTPLPVDSMANDTIRNIYGVYQAFFRPWDSTEHWQYRSNTYIREYCKTMYLLPQSFMHYGFSNNINIDSLQAAYNNFIAKSDSKIDLKYIHCFEDFVEEKLTWPPRVPLDTLHGFRPPLPDAPSQVLYYQPDYASALFQILEDSITHAGPSWEAWEMDHQKQRFLAPYLYVLPGNWGGWYIPSHPLAFSVVFDRQFCNAVVDCKLGYAHGWACYRKEGGRWRFAGASLPLTE